MRLTCKIPKPQRVDDCSDTVSAVNIGLSRFVGWAVLLPRSNRWAEQQLRPTSFMGSAHRPHIAHWDHEPFVVPALAGSDDPGPPKGGTTNKGRFMVSFQYLVDVPTGYELCHNASSPALRPPSPPSDGGEGGERRVMKRVRTRLEARSSIWMQ